RVDKWGISEKGDKTYAGGDVLDLGLVTDAIYHGRRAAETIHKQFRGIELTEEPKLPIVHSDKMVLDFYEKVSRREDEQVAPDERFTGDVWQEITKTLQQADAIIEARRCMSCGNCFDCGSCWSYCSENAIIKPLIAGELYTFKHEFCNGCDKCREVCPCNYIEMK
ncbi:MAG: hypothetical protein P9M15_02030, partial [Candidatus Electryoneaceae bacterium]|nr:hypothetical protein [Candidatus Electryoneaceae bacterium]